MLMHWGPVAPHTNNNVMRYNRCKTSKWLLGVAQHTGGESELELGRGLESRRKTAQGNCPYRRLY